MQCRNERRQLVFLNVLQFIDEENQRRSSLLRGGAHYLEQCLQVVLEIAVIREPWLRLEIQADFDVVVLDLQGARKAREPLERAFGQRLRLRMAGKAQQRLS